MGNRIIRYLSNIGVRKLFTKGFAPILKKIQVTTPFYNSLVQLSTRPLTIYVRPDFALSMYALNILLLCVQQKRIKHIKSTEPILLKLHTIMNKGLYLSL